MEQSWSVKALTEFVAESVKSARVDNDPFYHLEFDRVFPADFYAEMLRTMPEDDDYRAMSGKSKKGSIRPDGKPTRTKIDLFPEYIRHLPPEKLAVWHAVGHALRSDEVRSALMQKLGPGLQKRFGKDFANVGMYPVPILTRDIPGYRVFKHTDSLWKGITVQLYLPPDDSNIDIGTFFHDCLPDGSTPRKKQMRFAPNSGYAFAVGEDTWHSADTVGPEVTTRDSILLTYFVDSGVVKYLRNRGKRVGNFLLNEIRHISGR